MEKMFLFSVMFSCGCVVVVGGGSGGPEYFVDICMIYISSNNAAPAHTG